MVFDTQRITASVNSVTLETSSCIIWNASKLKAIIELIAKNSTYRNMLKDVDDIPLEMVLQKILYKMNAEIKRLADETLVDIVNMFGELLKDMEGADETFEELNSEYEAMTDVFEKFSESCRFQGKTSSLKEIVDNFIKEVEDSEADDDMRQKTPCKKYSLLVPEQEILPMVKEENTQMNSETNLDSRKGEEFIQSEDEEIEPSPLIARKKYVQGSPENGNGNENRQFKSHECDLKQQNHTDSQYELKRMTESNNSLEYQQQQVHKNLNLKKPKANRQSIYGLGVEAARSPLTSLFSKITDYHFDGDGISYLIP